MSCSSTRILEGLYVYVILPSIDIERISVQYYYLCVLSFLYLHLFQELAESLSIEDCLFRVLI
jgi:hypothetical protein